MPTKRESRVNAGLRLAARAFSLAAVHVRLHTLGLAVMPGRGVRLVLPGQAMQTCLNGRTLRE